MTTLLADEVADLAVGNVGVDTGLASTGTAVAPRDNTDDLVVGDERTSTVTLAGVLATLLKTSADHAAGDLVGVVAAAGAAVDDGNRDVLKGVRVILALLERAKTRDSSTGSGAGLRVRDTTNGLDGGSEGEILGQLENGHVIVKGVVVELWVLGEAGNLVAGAAAQLVTADANGHGRGTEAVGAVSSCKDGAAVEDSTTAVRGAVLVEVGLVGEILNSGLLSTDDVGISDGESHGGSLGGKADEGNGVLHAGQRGRTEEDYERSEYSFVMRMNILLKKEKRERESRPFYISFFVRSRKVLQCHPAWTGTKSVFVY